MRGRTWDAGVRWLPATWALILAVLLLGGALGRGFVLTYDMVWVPDLALGREALGLGTALPRAVPSDAVVAALDEVVPGELLQKLVLVGALVSAGAGAAALCGSGVVARTMATTVAVWNPFVVERLAIGHWPVLVGYGLLPWVVLAGSQWRGTGVLPARLPALLVVASLSATTGLVSALALCAAAATRTRARWARLAVLVGAANAPWVVSGLLHAADARSSAVGAVVFAPSGREGWLAAPVQFLTLGGVWNAEAVPASRTGVLGVLLTLFLLLLALAARRGWSEVPDLVRRPLLLMWVIGMGLTVATWALPGMTGWLASEVPGGGLLRDGSRMLALAAPLTAVLAGRGAGVVVGLLPDASSRTMAGLGLVLAPLALMPDVAWGLSGRLTAAEYPASYDRLVQALPSLPEGDAVLLPFESYRAPEWNDRGRPVLAPLGRYLRRDVVVEDQLVVDGRSLAGEDPRAATVRRALAEPEPEDRARGLRSAGVRLVVVEDIDGMALPEVAGDVVWRDSGLEVIDVGPGEQPARLPSVASAAMVLAWGAWLGACGSGLLLWVRRRRGAKYGR